MGFRLATVDGRAVLIDGADWHDLSAAPGGSFSGDPMEAIERHAELHDVAGLEDPEPLPAREVDRMQLLVHRPDVDDAVDDGGWDPYPRRREFFMTRAPEVRTISPGPVSRPEPIF